MKKRIKHLFLSIITTFTILGSMPSALADASADIEKLLNWAQNTYKNLFPSIQPTQTLEPWVYRFYPETGIYVGLNKNDNYVYVLGGHFGNAPQKIDTLAALIMQVDNSGGNTGVPGCDVTQIPGGITASQSGNVVTVTTNGKCIPMPQDANICKFSQQPTATNISVLGTNSVTHSQITGISISSGPNIIQQIVDGMAANVKICTINAPAGSEKLTVNSDLCFDITSAVEGLGIPGVTISPPVQYFMKGTFAAQTVADCFKTDASVITNAVTGETWTQQNGQLIKIK
ncbi:MAG: hypothetical protein WAU15_12635 [Nitrosomonas sp.]